MSPPPHGSLAGRGPAPPLVALIGCLCRIIQRHCRCGSTGAPTPQRAPCYSRHSSKKKKGFEGVSPGRTPLFWSCASVDSGTPGKHHKFPTEDVACPPNRSSISRLINRRARVNPPPPPHPLPSHDIVTGVEPGSGLDTDTRRPRQDPAPRSRGSTTEWQAERLDPRGGRHVAAQEAFGTAHGPSTPPPPSPYLPPGSTPGPSLAAPDHLGSLLEFRDQGVPVGDVALLQLLDPPSRERELGPELSVLLPALFYLGDEVAAGRAKGGAAGSKAAGGRCRRKGRDRLHASAVQRKRQNRPSAPGAASGSKRSSGRWSRVLYRQQTALPTAGEHSDGSRPRSPSRVSAESRASSR